MTEIHPTAIVDPKARLGERVRIGPYCTVGANAQLGDDVDLLSHVVVDGRTRIGSRTRAFPFAVIGTRPQDLKFHDEPSELIVGADNVIREHVTLNPGTETGGMVTRVGDGCLFMVGAHVAHDCQIGNQVIMANNATLGGHVTVEDFVIIGGLAAVHQFVRIGRGAMIGGMSGVENDVIPYGLVMGARANLHGLNIVGLKRKGFGRDQIQTMSQAYKMLFASEDTLAQRLDQVAGKFVDSDAVTDIVAFVRDKSSRALCQPKSENGG